MQRFLCLIRLINEAASKGKMKGVEKLVDEISFYKAKDGDGESFYRMLEPIKNKLYRVALIYMKNEDDALDCIHDSIVKAIQSIDKLKEPQHFNTWITRIMINTCKDHIRKNKNIEINDTTTFEEKLIYNNSNIEENMDLYKALDSLKENEKELIAMRYMDDMSIKDISQVTNVPMGTIKSSISRTIKKLRVYMKEV
ncbi:sigma-70 family RNA polymerase sigma factor [Clostridium mobile]|uniref:sigma-70 family RNA polymerase sigma factor n=1 Tax=Clostridium mobile TaxID=2841512 RepID=UPI001FE54EE1|nr:sigma-70 family RNA polymerase sigma factor [Clostridium mobile]